MLFEAQNGAESIGMFASAPAEDVLLLASLIQWQFEPGSYLNTIDMTCMRLSLPK